MHLRTGIPQLGRTPSPVPGARLGAAPQAQEPGQEGRLVNQQLSARRIEDSGREPVRPTAPERPGDTADAEQMRV
jgi:hypothetical protein